MSIRLSRRAPKGAIAMVGLVATAVALSGCSSLGSRTFGDPTTTGSLPQSAPQSYSQPMPSSLGAPQAMTAESQFLPPANVGGSWNSQPTAQPAWNPSVQAGYTAPMAPVGTASAAPSVQSQDLPVLRNPSSQGSLPAMQAQPSIASAPMPSPAVLGSLPTNSSVPSLASAAPAASGAATSGFTHTIASGESLYTIARRYEVTTQALVQANNLSSPDKIVVGQKVIIPGRADLLATKAPAATQVASATPMAAPAPAQQTLAAAPNTLQAATTPAAAAPAATAAPAQPAPVQVASVPAAEPAMSGSDKFRWPASGRVLVDFASSKGTGINIEVPEGSAVKAAENGTVIYVGSGVEGYGNLVLIRHPNGYVSAYAHLQSMNVAKGAVVGRGDTIGAAGMTGSVTKPQLHFELRKGATPVDPLPLLAS
ncbi:MAG: peptidoglycan DD-metalloendopeptidase family protein [Alphaproteobacteria bacterium]|nr:peptidoglycan DD-metalloendopeptidase family protein [Alphaproteobacteria bacterium]MBU1561383.1 peptidoglycan DD-metalloendopeptidase family protein [Alphaproteobacteria bacterium]MBU2302503.1 peptidoglycan DD-metalloendopeptidase family protein [Alphaproteobacteria bacterium]MBU2367491.1 peptidoglycan DD-metalloendopeptidase family protein [Alphaproteobacteria bacterium]